MESEHKLVPHSCVVVKSAGMSPLLEMPLRSERSQLGTPALERESPQHGAEKISGDSIQVRGRAGGDLGIL